MTTEIIVNESDPPANPIETLDALDATIDELGETLDASITVAAIEADRDVEIAQIQADTRLAEIEAASAAEHERLRAEIETWKARAEAAEASNIELTALYSTLQRSTLDRREPEPENPATSSEMNPPSDDAASEQTLVNPVVQEGAGPEPVKKRVKLRWI